uniref:Ras-associating domain-containing protein n=1 Tax=Parastrongyloides trichosuri TaxID=131310 RepID=A0A0N4ZLQ9_PARTI
MICYKDGEVIYIYNNKNLKQKAQIVLESNEDVAIAKRAKKNFIIPFDVDGLETLKQGKKKSKKGKESKIVFKLNPKTLELCQTNKNTAKDVQSTLAEFIETTFGEEWSFSVPEQKDTREIIVDALRDIFKNIEGKMLCRDGHIIVNWLLDTFPEPLKNMTKCIENSFSVNVSTMDEVTNEQTIKVIFKQSKFHADVYSFTLKNAPLLLSSELMEFRENLSLKFRHGIVFNPDMGFVRIYIVREKMTILEAQNKHARENNGKLPNKQTTPFYMKGEILTNESGKIDCIQNRILQLKKSILQSQVIPERRERPLSVKTLNDDVAVLKIGTEYFKSKDISRKSLIKPLKVSVPSNQQSPTKVEMRETFATSPTNSIDSGVGSPGTPSDCYDKANLPFALRNRSFSESISTSFYRIDGKKVSLIVEEDNSKCLKSILKKDEQKYIPRYRLRHTPETPTRGFTVSKTSRSVSECISNDYIPTGGMESMMSFETIISDDESSFETTNETNDESCVSMSNIAPRFRKKTISFSDTPDIRYFNNKISIESQKELDRKRAKDRRRKQMKYESRHGFTTSIEDLGVSVNN